MLLEPYYVECPHCKKWHTSVTLMSYTSYGHAECWSDGKCESLTISEYSFMPFARCTNCGRFFWFESSRKLKDYEVYEYLHGEERNENELLIKEFLRDNYRNGEIVDADLKLDYPPIEHWLDMPDSMIRDFLELLDEADNLLPDQEIYVRIKLWQHITNYTRYGFHWEFDYFLRPKILLHQYKERRRKKRGYKDHRNIQNDNMRKLYALLDNSENITEDSLRLKLELQRQMGNFDTVGKLIAEATAEELEYDAGFIEKTKKMMRRKSKKVFKL